MRTARAAFPRKAAVTAVFAQKLARRICEPCREPRAANPEIIASFVDLCARAGIEFVALGSAVWNDPRGPAAAVEEANRLLGAIVGAPA